MNLFFKLSQQCFSTEDWCFYHLVSRACWICSYRWYWKKRRKYFAYFYPRFRFVLSVRCCFSNTAERQCNDKQCYLYCFFFKVSSLSLTAHAHGHNILKVCVHFCCVEWYKWNSPDVGGVEWTIQQPSCLWFFKLPFVLRMVHLLSSLICENVKSERPVPPERLSFVLKIEEAGFKKSNKCLC